MSPMTPDAKFILPLLRTPWYYGWNVLAAGIAFQALTWGLAATFTLFVADWMNVFDASRAQVMLAIMCESIAIGVLAPFVGRFVDRMPIGLLVAGGGILVGLGLLMISISNELWHLIVACAVFLGLGKIMSGPLTASTLAAKWFRARRGLALGISATGTAVGSMLLVPLSGLLLENLGWRTTHIILGLLCIVVLTPLAAFIIRSSPESAGVEPEADSAMARHETKTERQWTIVEVLRSPVLWIIVLAILPFNIVTSAVNSNLGPLVHDLGHNIGLASQLLATMAACTILGKITLGSLADRVDTSILLVVAAAFMASGLAIMQTSPALPTLFLAAMLMGVGAGAPLPLVGIIIAQHFDRTAFGRVTGVCYFFILTFAGAGAVVGGYLRDVTGSYVAMFGALLAVLVPIVIAAIFLKSPKKAPQPKEASA